MCGICGIINFDGAPIDPHRLVRMRDLMQERGPDDRGAVLIDSYRAADVNGCVSFRDVEELGPNIDEKSYSIGLAHRRLSIIDLSSAGRQPMCNDSGTVWITFNGEIYNFQRLKQFLAGRGYRFRTNTDTEVILYAYEEWGKDFVCHLRGMFAIALWDRRRARCILARDRFGIKPLFYFHSQRSLVFASDLMAVLLAGHVQPSINPEAVLQYFKYHYVPAPNTILKDVFAVSPAKEMVVTAERQSDNQYWQIRIDGSIEDEKEATDLVETELGQVVEGHLIADVPVGCFLSGGVDSSLVTYFAKKIAGDGLKAYCIGFKEASYDESFYARMVADYLGVDLNIDIMDKPPGFDQIAEMVSCMDQPFADSSLIPTYQVCRNARRYFPVALSGDGGDEVFAGYSFRLQKVASLLYRHKAANFLAGALLSLLGRLGVAGLLPGAIKKIGEFSQLSLAERYIYYHLKSDSFDKLVNPEIYHQADSYPDFVKAQVEQQGWPDNLHGMLAICLHNNLPNDMLVKVDRASMAHSLEVRVPFLDHRLVESAFRLSASLKQPGIIKSQPKYVLKRIAESKLPREPVFRPKMGFSIPLHQWETKLHKYIIELFDVLDGSVFDYLNKEILLHADGIISVCNDTDRWAIFCFLIWYEKFQKLKHKYRLS